jgi:carbon starvation protein CstA
VIWRYFGWANQTLATIVLWAAAAYLAREAKLHWIASLPGTFMTAVAVTYICYDKIGFGLSLQTSSILGVTAAAASLFLFLIRFRKGALEAEAEAIAAAEGA